MTEVASEPVDVSSPWRWRRLWFLVAVDMLAVLGIVAVWFVLPERIDLGTRRMLTFVIVTLSLVAVAAWFFWMARLPRRTRLVAALVVGTAGLLVAGSIRRVEFSGDMMPSLDFRWVKDRDDLVAEHRARQRAAAGKQAQSAAAAPVEERPAEWDVLDYRGPRRDGVMPGPQLARDWSKQPPKLAWRQPVGGGYSSFVVAGPLAITIEQRRGNEAVVAYDVESGAERWAQEYPALFSEQMGGDGPRATPTIHDGKVFSLGATGVLTSRELNTGKPLWSVNILAQNETVNLVWAMSGSPLVYDGRVLVNPGNQKATPGSHAITTFDAATGKFLFGGGEGMASYCSPMLVTLGGKRQVLIFDTVGLAGFDPDDGRELWRTPWKSDFDINAAQPIVLDDERVFISSASGAALYKVAQADDKWTVEELWKNRRMKCGYSCPIVYQGHVYGISENLLACLDLADGKLMWKDRAGQFGHGQILLRDDLLLVLGEAGELALVQATPERYVELGRIQAIEGKTWNNPTLVGRRILVRNHLEMAAYDLPLEE